MLLQMMAATIVGGTRTVVEVVVLLPRGGRGGRGLLVWIVQHVLEFVQLGFDFVDGSAGVVELARYRQRVTQRRVTFVNFLHLQQRVSETRYHNCYILLNDICIWIKIIVQENNNNFI